MAEDANATVDKKTCIHPTEAKPSKFTDEQRVHLIKDSLATIEDLDFNVNLETMNLLQGVQNPLATLKESEGYLSMSLLPFKDLGKWEQAFLLQTVNLSRFADEEKENNVPVLKEDRLLKKNYDVSFERVVTYLPGLKLDFFTTELLANYEYLAYIFKDTGIETWKNESYKRRNNQTCRWSGQAIPLLYRMTCQWEISELDQKTLAQINDNFKLNYQRGFMMERTKQNIHQAADANLKSRVFMLYYETEAGLVLDFNWYCIMNFGIFTRTGVLVAYNAMDIGGEMVKCFHLLRKQILEWFLAALTKQDPIQPAGKEKEKENDDDRKSEEVEDVIEDEEVSVDDLSVE